MWLRDLPSGTTIFIDTNCLVYHFTGVSESCRFLLERVARREIVRSAQRCETALTQLSRFHLRVLPITLRLVTLARRLSHEFGLLTNDALLLATMRAYSLTHLASNDTDFLSVPSLSLWRP